MKQWVTTQKGLDDLKLTSAPLPEPGVGEVLVKVNAVSLNFRDTEGMPRSHEMLALAYPANHDQYAWAFTITTKALDRPTS